MLKFTWATMFNKQKKSKIYKKKGVRYEEQVILFDEHCFNNMFVK